MAKSQNLYDRHWTFSGQEATAENQFSGRTKNNSFNDPAHITIKFLANLPSQQ